MATSEEAAQVSGGAVPMLERWASLWTDLQHSGMALYQRQQLEAAPAMLFQRRALWESAVIAYGRADQSEHARKVGFKAFLQSALTADEYAIHERIMDWRHGHVAHRRDGEFEELQSTLIFASAVPSTLQVAVGIDSGAPEDFVEVFQKHVVKVCNLVWERKLIPLAVDVAAGLNRREVALAQRTAPGEVSSSAERYVVTLRWDLNARPRTA